MANTTSSAYAFDQNFSIDEIIADALAFGVAGPAFATRSDIMTITKVGEDGSVAIALESGTTHIDGTPITEGSRIVQESGNAASNNSDGRNAEEAAGGTIGNSGDPIVVEESISDAATYTQTGSSSGSALVLPVSYTHLTLPTKRIV